MSEEKTITVDYDEMKRKIDFSYGVSNLILDIIEGSIIATGVAAGVYLIVTGLNKNA